jgi:hypothetical protein
MDGHHPDRMMPQQPRLDKAVPAPSTVGENGTDENDRGFPSELCRMARALEGIQRGRSLRKSDLGGVRGIRAKPDRHGTDEESNRPPLLQSLDKYNANPYSMAIASIGPGGGTLCRHLETEREPWSKGVVRVATKKDIIELKMSRGSDQDKVDNQEAGKMKQKGTTRKSSTRPGPFSVTSRNSR